MRNTESVVFYFRTPRPHPCGHHSRGAAPSTMLCWLVRRRRHPTRMFTGVFISAYDTTSPLHPPWFRVRTESHFWLNYAQTTVRRMDGWMAGGWWGTGVGRIAPTSYIYLPNIRPESARAYCEIMGYIECANMNRRRRKLVLPI